MIAPPAFEDVEGNEDVIVLPSTMTILKDEGGDGSAFNFEDESGKRIAPIDGDPFQLNTQVYSVFKN